MLWKKLIALDLLVGHDNEYNQNKNSHVKQNTTEASKERIAVQYATKMMFSDFEFF